MTESIPTKILGSSSTRAADNLDQELLDLGKRLAPTEQEWLEQHGQQQEDSTLAAQRGIIHVPP
jgi:hypothetical protein